MSKIRLAIHGAGGRMGHRLVALGSVDPDLKIVAALEANNHDDIGKDAGALAGVGAIGVTLTSHLNTEVDAVIDFSVPSASLAIAKVCAERKIPLVMATTGFDHSQKEQIVTLGGSIPILASPSMSMAVNLAMKLAATAGQVLKDYPGGADVEIIERHHRFKEDAPSGTALRFGEIIAGVMGQHEHIHGRAGRPGHRPRHQIAYHALCTGDNPGEHTIVFGMLGETIELTVLRLQSRLLRRRRPGRREIHRPAEARDLLDGRRAGIVRLGERGDFSRNTASGLEALVRYSAILDYGISCLDALRLFPRPDLVHYATLPIMTEEGPAIEPSANIVRRYDDHSLAGCTIPTRSRLTRRAQSSRHAPSWRAFPFEPESLLSLHQKDARSK